MVIWSKLETSCPICSNRLPMREIGGGFVLGQDSDLLVRMEAQHVVQADVHSCRSCRFSGYLKDFLQSFSSAEKKSFLRAAGTAFDAEVKRTRTPREKTKKRRPGARKTPLPDIQYLWAQKTAEALGYSPTEQGLRLTRAYWCTRLAPTASLGERVLKARRKIYLKLAIQKLRQGLRFEDDPNLLYLIGELCRRNSNFLLAESYFRRYLRQEDGPTYLRQAAAKLVRRAREKNALHLTMEGLLYGKKTPQGEGREE